MVVRKKDGRKKDGGEKSNIIRPFGNLECYEFHMIQLRFLGNNIVSCRYAVPATLARPELDNSVVTHVEDAIARVVIDQPALRIDVVSAETKRPAWVAVDQIDFANHVQWVDISSDNETSDNVTTTSEMLQDRIERRLDEPHAIVAGRPRWRVLVLFKNGGDPFLDIMFDYSHALGDGTSGKIFHETLLRILNTPTSTPTAPGEVETRAPALTNRILSIPSTASTLRPPAEKIGKFAVSAKFAVTTVWKELQPPAFSSASAAQARWAPIRTAPYKTRFRAFSVQADVLRGILAACRKHKTTVTGLLHALLLASMASRIPARDATAFTGSTPLDLRRHLVDVDVETCPDFDARRTMADYVSAMAHEFDADVVRRIRDAAKSGDVGQGGDDAIAPALVDLVWQCAARVRGEIQKRLDCGLRNDIVGLMRLVPDWRAQFRAEARKARPNSFVVSNLGVLDGRLDLEKRDAESWSIVHSTFAISAEVCGAAFQVSLISVRDGALCIGCSWQDCVVDLKLAEAIVVDLERWLQFLGKSS
ncbi:alcohol acetyltransferase-domain-containing protein [Xylaria sp. FL1777]|nr:alcohol acetyltransferase-domain-containing protein [Xylaria sp. FL1777]